MVPTVLNNNEPIIDSVDDFFWKFYVVNITKAIGSFTVLFKKTENKGDVKLFYRQVIYYFIYHLIIIFKIIKLISVFIFTLFLFYFINKF